MGSTFTTFPDGFDQTSTIGTKRKLPIFLQFVPGIVLKVAPGQENPNAKADLRNINSITAMPHETNLGVKKPSDAADDENFRYYPLLRGIQESPTPGDPVLLCTFEGEGYYLGPLNTDGSPTFNEDKFKDSLMKVPFDSVVKSEGGLKSGLFAENKFQRLQKLLNKKLDNPDSEDFVSDTIHGDLMLEGRHGNSIRIGSRNINPYIIISNGRAQSNPVETSLDGTILAILENGSVRDHFNVDMEEFELADEQFAKTVQDSDSVRSILKTFTHPLGSGRKADEKDISVGDEIYNYNENQLFASSDRITFNARKESMFLSAYKHIHIGCGSSMTFSTSKNILINTAESVVTNTGMFKVNSEAAYIDGRKKVVIGSPLLNDQCHPAVVGNGLVMFLSLLINEIKDLAWSVGQAVESTEVGASIGMMQESIDAFDKLLGVKGYEDPILEESYEVPETMTNLILSDKVFIKK